MDANLIRRITFAAVAIPLAILLVWLGGWPLAVLVAVVGALGTREFFDIAAKQGNHAFREAGIAAAIVGVLLVHRATTESATAAAVTDRWAFMAAAFVLLLLGLALRSRGPDAQPLGAVAVTLFGVVYAGLLPSFLLTIRHGAWPERSWGGTAMVLFPLVVTWVCDSAAMFGGRAFGGAKLAPTISPGKTRSGGISGVVGAAVVAPLFALWLFPKVGVNMSLADALAIAVLLGVVGQLGDLAESLFKREAGVKDSSTLIPGHGGVLDRFDSLYVVLPTTAFCYHLLGLL